MIRDDRIHDVTRWASLAIFVILVPAVIMLWGFPGDTADAWSWTIMPDLTPIFLGSGYAAGAFFFWRTFRAKRWHPSSAGVLGASVFAGLMLIATVIHWDKFNHGDAPFLAGFAFYGWVIVYIVSPLAVFWLWWRNRRTDPRTALTGDPLVAPGVLTAARAFGIGAFAAAAVFFISPQTAIDIWPWDLTPLTARVLASFTAQVGVGAIVLSMDPRWSGWKLLTQTFFVATAFLLVGVVRAHDDFDFDNPMAFAYIGGLIATDVALALLYRAMNQKKGSAVG